MFKKPLLVPFRLIDSFKDLADRQALEAGIAKGRGGLYLELTAQQCAILKRR